MVSASHNFLALTLHTDSPRHSDEGSFWPGVLMGRAGQKWQRIDGLGVIPPPGTGGICG